jgi:hypothetical protein
MTPVRAIVKSLSGRIPRSAGSERQLRFRTVETPGRQEEVAVPSALRREGYVQLSRRVQRRQFGLRWRLIGALLAVVLVGAVYDRRWWLVGVVLAYLLIFAVATWRQPYRLWSAQGKTLAAPGTLTFGGEGLRREIPGVVDARFPWSRIEAMVDTGRVIGLQAGRIEWVMVPVPDDPAAAQRLRDFLSRHVPAA